MAKAKGSEARFLVSVDDNTSSSAVLVDLDGSNHTSAEWLENLRVTDEENNFSSSKVDSTDREAMRNGFETEDVVSIGSEITFSMFNVPGDLMVDYFVNAWLNRTTVPCWAADGDPDNASVSRPVQGLAANFSVEIRPSRPVKGLQVYAVTLTASSKPVWYKITTALVNLGAGA